MRLASFRTVRGRLLALLIGIALPIACLTAITATTTYQTVTSGIETAQKRTGDDYVIRARLWYRGLLRSLLASGSTLARNGDTGPEECSSAAARVLEQVKGYRALYVISEQKTCTASTDPAIPAAELVQAMAALRAKPAVEVWSGALLTQARYDFVELGGRRHLAVYARDEDATKPFNEGLLLVDPDLLQQVFNFGESEPGLQAALVSTASGVVGRARGCRWRHGLAAGAGRSAAGDRPLESQEPQR